MKKILLACVAILGFALNSSNAKAQSFVKGDDIVGATIGIGTSFDFSGIPPIGVMYEHGLVNDVFQNGWNVNLGLGAEGGFWSTSTTYNVETMNGKYTEKSSTYYSYAAVRGALHKEFVSNLDTYAGLSLGLEFSGNSSKFSGVAKTSSSNVGFGWSGFIGCRYYFTPNWAINGELGWGISLLNIGVTYKF